MPTITKLYSMQEASLHNNKDDCWVVVDGKVYDVTKYLDDHPGGDDVLLSASGRDSTEEFEEAGHSTDARKLMEDYFIGELDPSPSNPAPEITSKKRVPLLTSLLTKETVRTLAFPAAAIGVSVVVAILFYSHKKH